MVRTPTDNKIPDAGISNAIVVGGMGRERNLITDPRITDYTPTTHIKGKVNREGIRKIFLSVGVLTNRNNPFKKLTQLCNYIYQMETNPYKRQGQMDTLQSYFYTDSIFEHKHLLANDHMKTIIIDSWKYLVNNKKIKIYAFVIMPNHIHLIWNMQELNGKESPAGSFAKFTAHQFQKYLVVNNPEELKSYASKKSDRKFQF